MPLTLAQYAAYLDTRRDLSWPPPPEVHRPKVRPHLVSLSGVRAVLFSAYGTLINIAGGDLFFEHPRDFVMKIALERTIQEFKMWQSMSRKPGQPSDYLLEIYRDTLLQQRARAGSVERFPEVRAEAVWEAILKRLLQKDYELDASSYGSLNQFSIKVAYFFHCCLQGYAAHESAAATLRKLADRGARLGLAADGQCFTTVQLGRALAAQDPHARCDQLFDAEVAVLSSDVRARTTSERLFKTALEALAARGLMAAEVLYVNSRLPALTLAKRLGMRTALFAGDKASLEADPDKLNRRRHRPDVLLSELGQLDEVVG